MRNVKIKIVSDKLDKIDYASAQAAGIDLKACIDEEITINPGEIVKIPTGIQVSAEKTDIYPMCFLLFGRSGLGVNHGITLANAVGVIDSDYRGEFIAGLINNSLVPYTIKPMDRIAQFVLVPIERMNIIISNELDETERGSGGFGSTGR